jgi:hypothetical protein
LRNLLDLIQEYATLNEAKTVARGVLPPALEARWAELKRFYDMLMAQDGLARDPASRFTPVQIRERVVARTRLRVDTDLEIVVVHGPDYHRARVGNMSLGGALILCDAAFAGDDELTLLMANVSRGASVLPTSGRVRWQADRGKGDGTFRYRAGVQFIDLGEAEARTLDAFLVDSLETKLLCLGRESLDPEFLRKERVELGPG